MSAEWQPIETLPKKSNWVLGWAPGWMVVMMTYVDMPPYLRAGWYVGDGKYIEATHWRDLPEPPDLCNPTD